ncbi:MAG: phosphodiester glycosidase family protein [Actinomycetota bacterium]
MALLACALVVATLAPGVAPHVDAASRYRKRTVRLGPGLTLTRMLDRRGPNRVRILKVDPSTTLTTDVALARDKLPGLERTSSMARRRGAVAAVNGDYTIHPFDAGAGRPINAFARNGSLKTSPLIWGRNFAVSQDEDNFYFDHAPLKVSLSQRDSGELWSIQAWNERGPTRDVLSVSTPAGGLSFRPLTHACSARLLPRGRMSWGEGKVGVRRTYEVDRVRCSADRLRRGGGLVVSAGRGAPAGQTIRASLSRGEVVDLTWSMGTWAGVLDTIGGNPLLVAEGLIAAETCTGSYFCYRNPRTGIGITSSGKLLLVTVDGRRPGWSTGMTPIGFARLFRFLGARWALNLDGGGSTTMWVKDKIVNRPSDPGGERAVGSSILVLPVRDPSEPRPLDPPSKPVRSGLVTGALASMVPSIASGDGREDPARLTSLDPASTGGMLDALARGAFGPMGPTLPRSVRPVLQRFRDRYGGPIGRPLRPLRLPSWLGPAAPVGAPEGRR